MNIRYIKPAAKLMTWGFVLFVVGGALSGALSAMAVAEEIQYAFSPFSSSEASGYRGGATVFGIAAFVGLILILVGAWRLVGRIDQRYDSWFSRLQRPRFPQEPAPGQRYPAAPGQAPGRGSVPGHAPGSVPGQAQTRPWAQPQQSSAQPPQPPRPPQPPASGPVR